MLINLKTSAGLAEQHARIELQERLPVFILSPCVLECQYKVTAQADYYLVNLKVNAVLTLICQRCLHDFSYDYTNQLELAVCDSEQKAEKLMTLHECIVASHNQVNLVELLTDELHLYVPKYHPQRSDCDEEVSCFIRQNE